MKYQIRAGYVSEISKESGDWLFVDVGFASKRKSCGILKNDGQPVNLTFRAMVECVVNEAQSVTDRPLNLLLEAPLSSAFNKDGNPTGRNGELKGGRHRYWYESSGVTMVVATGYLLRALVECGVQREVRLFEGFVSFKDRDNPSSHEDDVEALREVVWNQHMCSIVSPADLKREATDKLVSAHRFAGMDFDIPPCGGSVGPMGVSPLSLMGQSKRLPPPPVERSL